MKTIWYESIEEVLLNITDPNTWGAVSEVPWVSSPKINWGTSIYNIPEWWSWLAGWSTDVNWTASDYNTVSWTAGNIYLPDWTSIAVSSWNTGNMGAVTYIYYDRNAGQMWTTTSGATAVWDGKILLCVAWPTSSWKDAEFQAFGTNAQSTFITADNIAANTITGNEIQANSITASELNVDELSAITANLWDVHVGTTTGSGSGIRVYPYSSSQWRMEFYYDWDVVGSITGAYVPWPWDAIYIVWWTWSWYIALWGNVSCMGKLKIPVWTDLYN